LRSDLGTRTIKGKVLEQWQYEVTGAGRIWYCPDDALHVVFITKASTGHPSETDWADDGCRAGDRIQLAIALHIAAGTINLGRAYWVG